MTTRWTLPTAAYGALEIALNRYIGSDERALARCAELSGRSLQIDCSDLDLTLVFVATVHGMQVMAGAESPADVRLTGQSRDFARVFFAGEEGLSGSALRIEGDVGIAQQFARLFTAIDFDLGDWLDARLGPVPARFIGLGLRGAGAFARRAAATLPEDLAEYLREETRDVIGSREHAAFAARVNRLRADSEHLRTRIRRLAAHWQAPR
ncbi:MAG TPA: SCP2 sterol-binding domain-containing protein [Salinisphaeraceae bacterium]|nr:SCP2 sterol-binding domain-containing protein [Salinisphaeraceae bacterium]